jgi:TonB family protein
MTGQIARGCVKMDLTAKEGLVRRSLIAAALVIFATFGALAQDQVYRIGDGVKSPVIIKEVKPNYTEGAIRRKVQGTVEVTAVVLTDGTVEDSVKVIRSLDEELDQQAVNAARQWRFRPGMKDGQPVAVQVSIELTFTLRDKK